MKTLYYTATSLDGFIADAQRSLDWLTGTRMELSSIVRLRAVCLVWSLILLSACGAPSTGRDEAPTATPQDAEGVVDWHRREVSLRAPGWSVEFCDGEGPFLCVERGGESVGSVELLSVPLRSHALLTDVLARGGSEREALEAAAADFVAALGADRSSGLGEDYEMRADPPVEAVVMGKPGIRLSLEGRLADRVLERIVQYRVIDGDTFYLLAATGNGDVWSGYFAVDDLQAFEPLFGEIAAASLISQSNP
jgi:hypothetical protein